MKVEVELSACKGPISGIGLYVANLFGKLDKDGIEMNGVIMNFKNKETPLLKNIGFPCRQIHWIPLWPFAQPWFKRFGWIYNCFIKSTADIYIFTANSVPYAFSPKGGKVILILHDLVPFHEEDYQRAACLSVTYSANLADYIITISEYSKNEISNMLHVDPAKIIIIPPAVHHEQYITNNMTAANIMNVKQKYGIIGDYIIFIGTPLGRRKNLLRILLAYKMAKERLNQKLQFVCVGDPEALKSVLVKLKAESDIDFDEEIISIWGISEKEKIHLIKGARCMVFPSLFEGFGIPALESIAAGTPLITAKNTSLTEVAGDAAYYVDPHSEEEISKAIIDLCTDSELGKSLSEKGLLQAKKYTWDESSEKLRKLLLG